MTRPYWVLTDIEISDGNGGWSLSSRIKHDCIWGGAASLGMRMYVTQGLRLGINTQYDYVLGIEMLAADSGRYLL
jgi:hypothetical protein